MGVKSLFILFEHAAGYALFERVESEEIGMELDEVASSITELSRFSKIMKLKSFLPFTSAESALENVNSISEGVVSDYLKNFLEVNLPKVKKIKKAKFQLGVADPRIGSAIQELLTIPSVTNEVVRELLRGIRMHFQSFIKALKPGDLEQAQLGLGHSYSRCKVKFNVHRVDNMIIQSICLLDQLDKDLNTFAMRVREWYSWHFPEMGRIVKDNYVFARLAKFIQVHKTLSDDKLEALTEITMDESVSREILEASKTSMGSDVSEIDIANITMFAERVISLSQYRKTLSAYLTEKMNSCAPNLAALIGEMVGARLISHAGSLTNLSKMPASTVQILGAEKALFRALKTRGNTPKYGLIFHSSFIQRAGAKNKGRISRYLANKCAMASRIDSFTEVPNSVFGKALKQQVEDRLEFYDNGEAPKTNIEVMRAAQGVLDKLNVTTEDSEEASEKKSKKDKKKKKKRKHDEMASTDAVTKEDSKKGKKKPKKEKKAAKVVAKAEQESAKVEKKSKKKDKKEKKSKKKDKKEKKSKKKDKKAKKKKKKSA
eukprot:620230_1